MSSIGDKILTFMGLEEAENKDNTEEVAEEDKPKAKSETQKTAREKRSQGGDEKVDMSNVAAMKMIVYHPASHDDAQNIIDNLRNRKPIIVNMEDLDSTNSQRLLDYISGAIYALEGSIRKISRNIFLVAPANYQVEASGESVDDFVDM